MEHNKNDTDYSHVHMEHRKHSNRNSSFHLIHIQALSLHHSISRTVKKNKDISFLVKEEEKERFFQRKCMLDLPTLDVGQFLLKLYQQSFSARKHTLNPCYH